MGYVDLNVVKAKKDNLRVEIESVKKEIEQLRSENKISLVSDKERLLNRLKQEWQEMDSIIGKEQVEALNKSFQESTKNPKEYTWANVSINEEWAMSNHYTRMAIIKREITRISRKIAEESDLVKKINLEEKKYKLEEEYNELKNYTREAIIVLAKNKRAAYLNAKSRYSKLSALQKLKIKFSGKELSWDKVKDDYDISAVDLDTMYIGRSK